MIFEQKPVVNIIAERPPSDPGLDWILLGAHYDSRLLADQDPDPQRRSQPVPGANDGASGVALLIELARVLSPDLPKKVTLVFFDAEDNGGIEDWDWILGSRAFVESLVERPDGVVIVDMIGDADLNLYYEGNSDAGIMRSIWSQAAELDHKDAFIPQTKYSMLDDHIPFLRAGIPTALIIDFDYPYWHTVADTPDKVSAESLQMVGETLLAWLESQ